MIDNAIDFFTAKFVRYQVSDINEQHNFEELLPELACEVGADVTEVIPMYEYCRKC